jgi:hypothetical protein
MYSLRYPRLESVIRKYEQVIDQQSSVTTIEIKENTTSRRGKNYGKKTSLQKLRELDGQKENQ